MENARALDDRLRKIIREVSDSTGREMKQHLVENVVQKVEENNSNELKQFLMTLNRALKKI
ncbi:hypothetical protein SAMN05660649_02694 [Desulfotomaculum arcticum]|uniref:Uncharacterized protein n=1 Tax=Desulfotruncus arcticus DSM 17038 TaxID=1121424 RepID=A0A1I2USY9_9FIRM|nr:hypothetical protein [Desulfotruncus arcticus]SFG78066.1 hypothetical protein SAMN05660649_02694 [Desulfotomaculum arcticum] [Desulfotruncus arcticus DSM 17038]